MKALNPWIFYSTYGLPLSITADKILQHGMEVDWEGFRKDAINSGMKENTVDLKIKEAKEDLVYESLD